VGFTGMAGGWYGWGIFFFSEGAGIDIFFYL
jgi:hypothetical protein